MALTLEQQRQREGKITASFLPQLMAGDEWEIHNKWLELIGDPEWQPKDLSDNFPAFHGTIMEPHILDWHERKTQKELSRRGEVAQHPQRPFVVATLDAWRAFDNCVLDCKCPGAWMTLDNVVAHYTPQMICQRACAGAERAGLIVSHGGATPVELEIHIDSDYEALVWQRVDQFWSHVQDLRPPVALPTITPPDKWRAINLDLESDDSKANWAQAIKPHLEAFTQHYESAALYEEAKSEIKILLPEDCRKLTYQSVTITRARNRAVTIKRATT